MRTCLCTLCGLSERAERSPSPGLMLRPNPQWTFIAGRDARQNTRRRPHRHRPRRLQQMESRAASSASSRDAGTTWNGDESALRNAGRIRTAAVSWVSAAGLWAAARLRTRILASGARAGNAGDPASGPNSEYFPIVPQTDLFGSPDRAAFSRLDLRARCVWELTPVLSIAISVSFRYSLFLVSF